MPLTEPELGQRRRNFARMCQGRRRRRHSALGGMERLLGTGGPSHRRRTDSTSARRAVAGVPPSPAAHGDVGAGLSARAPRACAGGGRANAGGGHGVRRARSPRHLAHPDRVPPWRRARARRPAGQAAWRPGRRPRPGGAEEIRGTHDRRHEAGGPQARPHGLAANRRQRKVVAEDRHDCAPMPSPELEALEAAEARVFVPVRCEIVCRSDSVCSRFAVAGFGTDGTCVWLAESPPFLPAGDRQVGRSRAAVAAHRRLLDQLTEQGWEPAGHGEAWYEARFQPKGQIGV